MHHSSESTPSQHGHQGFTLIEVLIVLAVISIVAAIAASASLYAFDASRLGRTVANIRGVATSLNRYQTDTSSLPGGGLQTVSSIAAVLAPVSGQLPTVDGWGHDLYYEPVTVNGEATFRVFGYGKDGTPDGVITGTWVDFYTDVINQGGSFIQTKW